MGVTTQEAVTTPHPVICDVTTRTISEQELDGEHIFWGKMVGYSFRFDVFRTMTLWYQDIQKQRLFSVGSYPSLQRFLTVKTAFNPRLGKLYPRHQEKKGSPKFDYGSLKKTAQYLIN